MAIKEHITRKARSVGLMAFATLGFVLWTALTDRSEQPLSIYVTRWLAITAFFCAAFVIGMATNYLLLKLPKTKLVAKIAATIENILSSIESRFRGDRTKEEYQRAENGLIILVAIIALLGMLFLVGVWTIAAFSLFVGLTLARNIFIILNSDAEPTTSNIVINLVWGFSFAFLADSFYNFF